MRTPKLHASIAAHFREIIPALLEKFLLYEKTVVNSPLKKEEFHDMRIAGKPLRYVLEIVKPVFGRRAAECLKELVVVLDTMGTIHDHDVAIHILRDYVKELEMFNEKHRSAKVKIPVTYIAGLLREQRRLRTRAYADLRSHFQRWKRERIAAKFLEMVA